MNEDMIEEDMIEEDIIDEDIINAKNELLSFINNKTISYAKIVSLGNIYVYTNGGSLDDFMNSLDFEYDSGYGAQELFGFVVFTDGSWLERWEYDGSERWELKETPTIEFIDNELGYAMRKYAIRNCEI